MIQLTNLNKTFGQNIAVSNMNMTLTEGKVMGLIGQNGAGKTTTFRMLLNFIKPTSGTITWNDQQITQNDKQRIGFLPEERGLYQKRTVEEQILYFAELHGMKRSDARVALKDWMKRLDVVGKVSDKVQSLSKGNSQKVQMIASLIFEPSLLILDEPFSGLDPVNTSLMMDEIIRLRDNGAMIIFSSHDMNNVTKISDDLTMLKRGKIVLQGPVQNIREQFGRTRVYVESSTSSAALKAIDGVASVTPHGVGYDLILSEEEAGHRVFDLVTKNGYIPAFSQQPPTLDDIFRQEVAIHD
ncbi:ABC transporter ATP-binding protein [Leuconostoc mesenteroides]|uniref:ABC transporter, ATP-binding protein n=1 Tax=Leuconostoc mesenteroides subsp. cremoris ATCC 19254 TaxID=586220 RepID=C2KLQ7_LEUMC|nr:ABC transporter ATP-binding protein [Leuconostoc mesenteroides]EQC83921.1 sodium ABC transporter ATP-binding protein [Leuconostoc mesenteroides subsp. cremoris TIFN8]KDA51015.1 ABC transporter ATP binding protein [Leuconostoc mesenteroides subsp. cremoris T26]EEJ41801.1 ABC transporter, ATP-binding protein [Leuconostoc mesenteroides subsp. cremoris ATCC 19254]MDG9750895.1 ABC transporter ATP-binding protein [Leuconostoc mesenteroides]ORI39382.1 sodium ABC transporter ATP-binding protein [Le